MGQCTIQGQKIEGDACTALQKLGAGDVASAEDANRLLNVLPDQIVYADDFTKLKEKTPSLTMKEFRSLAAEFEKRFPKSSNVGFVGLSMLLRAPLPPTAKKSEPSEYFPFYNSPEAVARATGVVNSRIAIALKTVVENFSKISTPEILSTAASVSPDPYQVLSLTDEKPLPEWARLRPDQDAELRGAFDRIEKNEQVWLHRYYTNHVKKGMLDEIRRRIPKMTREELARLSYTVEYPSDMHGDILNRVDTLNKTPPGATKLFSELQNPILRQVDHARPCFEAAANNGEVVKWYKEVVGGRVYRQYLVTEKSPEDGEGGKERLLKIGWATDEEAKLLEMLERNAVPLRGIRFLGDK